MANLSTAHLWLAAGAKVDLHLHTVHSDGTWLPEQLFDYLVGEQFRLIAIADHDRPDTALALQRLALKKCLPLVVAVEMSTLWRSGAVDLLCFGYDPQSNALERLAQDVWRRQDENTREVCANLFQRGQIRELSGAVEKITAQPSAQQPHEIIRLLRSQGGDVSEDAAWTMAEAAGMRFKLNDLAAVVEAAHQSGAVCLVAHPGRTDGFVTFDERLLDELRAEIPIDGLEVYHPAHTSERTALYREYARQHDLFVSSGSDSHGPRKPPIAYRAEQSQKLLEWLGVTLE